MLTRKASFKERLAYRIDYVVAWNPIAKAVGLFAATLAIIAVGGAALWALTQGNDLSTSLWSSWGFIADSAAHISAEGWVRWAGFGISLGGLVLFALLVGLITDGVAQRMEELKEGRSRVIETGHTLIIGWSEKVIPLVRELCFANQSAGGRPIVILSDHPKGEMEDEIRQAIRSFHGSRVVCRSGRPASLASLEKVGAEHARAIVVIGGGTDEADAASLRVGLGLRRVLEGAAAPPHVVMELREPDNAAIADAVGLKNLVPVVTPTIIGRLMIQSFRQTGLAQVLNALLGFQGDELYLKEWPQLHGRTFGEAWRSFPAAVICGVRRKGQQEALLCPPDELVLAEGDRLLALAEDDDSYALAPATIISAQQVPVAPPTRKAPENLLVCGWRHGIADMISELDRYVSPGTKLTVFAELPEAERLTQLEEAGLELRHLDVRHRLGRPSRRRDLEALAPQDFDSVIVLGDDTDDSDAEEIDSRALTTLLLIRQAQSTHGRKEVPLISEIRDPATKELVSVAGLCDYVVSSEIISKYLAQVAEEGDIAAVWGDLLSSGGHEVYVKEARAYAADGELLSFWELAARARIRGEVALGYREGGGNKPVLNPKDKTARRAFRPDDVVVVISQDER